jgi:hypothetical protein
MRKDENKPIQMNEPHPYATARVSSLVKTSSTKRLVLGMKSMSM